MPPAPSTSTGLTSAEAARVLADVGANELRASSGPSVVRILAAQLSGALVWLLIGATVLSAVLGEGRDAIAIAVILVVNALIGFLQEYRAEKAVLALKKLTAPHARVVRDGVVKDVVAREVVPGDLLVLAAGDIVAADAALLESHRLQLDEATLTGESLPVDRSEGAVFAGTSVAAGAARAVVSATGMSTELGKIAAMLSESVEEETPLQKRLAKVGRMLLVLCLAVVAVVAATGLVRGTPPLELLMSSVSLAVAAVPEGLAAIVTIALAIGVQRMVAQHVLIRRLPVVETLGCATVICTDKTGTLTTGKMRVREVWGADRQRALDVAASCCDADLEGNTGDPTELAMLAAADEVGIKRADIEARRPRLETFPFDAERKRMSVMRADGVLYVKGAVDLLLPLCARVDVASLAAAHTANADMARRGLRVLAVAVGTTREERELELVGLVGLADPPRTEAIEAVEHARAAGVKTVMITGDHRDTALAIAREIGIVRDGDDANELVHARATPGEKLDIVRAHKANGAIVAMTGDGVNDAPALKEAHIGIAMGNATEVTREAADMILVDDNFASIVAAIREGRGVYDNIQKALVYLLAGNVGELLVMLIASLVGAPLPLTPLELLWINLVTDGLPALALVFDAADVDVLSRPPRKPDEPMLGRAQWISIVLTGVVDCSVALGVFLWALAHRDLATARNLTFSVMVIAEVFRAFAARSATKVFPQTPMFGNALLLVVVFVTVFVQLALQHVAFTERLFGLAPLSSFDAALTLALGLVPVTVLELAKLALAVITRSSRRA